MIILKEGQKIIDEEGNTYITEGDEILVESFLTERIRNLSDALELFGIKKVPDEKELKDLYRKLSIQNHPDKGGSVEMMQDVNAAYELLRNNIGKGKVELDWKQIKKEWEDRNKTQVSNMSAMFDDEFNIEELVKYLQQFTQDELQYTVEDNIDKIRDWSSPFLSYTVHIEVFNVDRTTVFMLEYYMSYNFNSGGGLTSSEVDEKDILYSVSINANIYHDKRKEKVSKSDYQYRVGRTSFTDFDTIFPVKKLQKVFSGSVKKAFKKSDMLLGLQRELNAEFNDDYIYFYLFGKRGETKTYISMYRSTFMKQGFYMINNLWRFDSSGKLNKVNTPKYYVSLPETQETLETVVKAINEIKREIIKRKLDERKDGVILEKIVDDILSYYFPKK